MKIGWLKIVGGPNLQFLAVTALFVSLSMSSGSPWPLAGWLTLSAALVPLCLWLHDRSARENRRLADEFPLDPEIQRRYGYRTYSAQEINEWVDRVNREGAAD